MLLRHYMMSINIFPLATAIYRKNNLAVATDFIIGSFRYSHISGNAKEDLIAFSIVSVSKEKYYRMR